MPKLACPHCGGSKFNGANLDYGLTPIRVEEDGSISEGPSDEGSDCQSGANTILHCHGCSSDFPLPVGTRTHFDESLKHDENEPSGPTGPRIGAKVFWLALTEDDLARLLRDYAVTPNEPIAQRMRVLDRLRQGKPLNPPAVTLDEGLTVAAIEDTVGASPIRDSNGNLITPTTLAEKITAYHKEG